MPDDEESKDEGEELPPAPKIKLKPDYTIRSLDPDDLIQKSED
jgi:hypothetical protein